MSMSLVGIGLPCATAAKPPITMKRTWCRARTSRIAGPSKSAGTTGGLAEFVRESDRRFEPSDASLGRIRRERFGLDDVGVVVRGQLDEQLEPAQSHQSLDLFERR